MVTRVAFFHRLLFPAGTENEDEGMYWSAVCIGWLFPDSAGSDDGNLVDLSNCFRAEE